MGSVNVDLRLLKASVEWVGWGGMHSHFFVQPNYSVEVVLWLCYVVVGVVTIVLHSGSKWDTYFLCFFFCQETRLVWIIRLREKIRYQ